MEWLKEMGKVLIRRGEERMGRGAEWCATVKKKIVKKVTKSDENMLVRTE